VKGHVSQPAGALRRTEAVSDCFICGNQYCQYWWVWYAFVIPSCLMVPEMQSLMYQLVVHTLLSHTCSVELLPARHPCHMWDMLHPSLCWLHASYIHIQQPALQLVPPCAGWCRLYITAGTAHCAEEPLPTWLYLPDQMLSHAAPVLSHMSCAVCCLLCSTRR
jgi:hypothetical protein